MEVKRKNVKEDLKLLISLGIDYGGEAFSIKFTSGNYGVKEYVCSFDGDTKYTNCRKVDDTHVLCLLDNHGLSCGLVTTEIKVCMPDTQMPDGDFRINERKLLEFVIDGVPYHLELINGASDTINTPEVTFELLGTVLRGKDGKDGRDGIDGRDGADGRDGQDGKDGINGRDGIDGKDGKDGRDGADGHDGYTPQKGIDYFDGRDGIDGKDGVDGSILYPSMRVDAAGYLVVDVPDESEGTNMSLDGEGYLCVNFPDL